MPFQTYEIALLSLGLLPIILIVGAFIVMGALMLASRLTPEDITEILLGMGTIWLIVIFVLIFISTFCGAIHPVERFDNPDDFMTQLAKTEVLVCSMIDDVDQFIASNLGNVDPSIVDAAKQKARDDVNMVFCPPGVGSVDDRLARLEDTLKNFTGPQLEKTYKKAMTCEGFSSSDPSERLQGIQNMIGVQYSQMLGPMKQKQKDLQSGKASDCDKEKASRVATSSSLNMIKGSGPSF